MELTQCLGIFNRIRQSCKMSNLGQVKPVLPGITYDTVSAVFRLRRGLSGNKGDGRKSLEKFHRLALFSKPV